MALTFNAIARAASFSPSQAFPLDARSYFESYSAAYSAAQSAAEAGTKAASNTVYYIGQTLVVNENNKAILYIIQPDKTLKEVGSVPVGDGKSIEVVDGKIKLKGFGSGYYKYNQKYKPAPVEGEDNRAEDEKSQYIFVESGFKAGLQPQIVAAASGDGFEIAWFEPNPTTVEGLQSEITALSASVNTLSGKVDSKANSVDVYTKDEANDLFMTEAEVDARVNKVITDAVEGDTLTSLTELVQYINTHGGQAGEMATAITKVENKLNGIAEGTGTVKKYVDDEIDSAINELNIGQYATAQSVTDLTSIVNGKVNLQDVKDEIDSRGFLTEHQDISGKADKSEVKELADIINGDVNTEGTLKYQLKQVEDKILSATDIDNIISGKNHATKDELDKAVEGMATQTWVNTTLEEYAKVSDIPECYITSADSNFEVTNGKLSIKSLNVNKLEQTEGEELVLNGGAA